MKIGHDGLPVLGPYSKDTALVGYFGSTGSKFLREITAAIEVISDGFARNSAKLEEMSYSGEIDFLAKEMGVRWEVLDDVELGKISLLWMNPVMLNRLPQDSLNRVDELLTNKALRAGGGLSAPSFKGKSFQQCVDIIAHDLRAGHDMFSNLSVADFLGILRSPKANDPDKRVLIPHSLIDGFDKTDEEFGAFERYRLSRTGKRTMEDGDFEIVQDLASRVADEVGRLEIDTYSYSSSIKNFSMIIQRRFREDCGGVCDEDTYTPYDVRDRKYSPPHPWSSMVELE
jgi:hypothetical protein